MEEYPIIPIGQQWPESSLIWGARGGHGASVEQISPVDRSCVQCLNLIDERELKALLHPKPILNLNADELWRFTDRFYHALLELEEPLLEAMRWETAFTLADCREVTAGSLQFVREFRQSLHSIRRPLVTPIQYQIEAPVGSASASANRRIRMVSSPWGTIAVILPQSAFLITAVTCLLNALAAGNRVILRALVQGARSAALLALAIEQARPPHETVSIVQVKSKQFVAALNQSPMPCLIHYMGSSRYAPEIHSDAFQKGNWAIIDGEGNTWVWVDRDADIPTVVEILTSGATRYKGQTCTSINGAMIHPAIYAEVRDALTDKWQQLRAGNPVADEIVNSGPLLDELQSQWIERRIEESGGKVLCGGQREGSLLQPTLVEKPGHRSALVSDGVFGCALWIAPGDQDVFVQWWPRNRFPLCAGVR